MSISKEHRDALNKALDETAGYEGDVYVFDVKHIETLRSAVVAMLEDDEQIAPVAPAVDAQPVVIYQVQTGDCWLDMTKEQFDNHSKSRPTRIVYASAQSEGWRKDALDALRAAEDALSRCYDVTEWPCSGETTQDAALATVRAALAKQETHSNG